MASERMLHNIPQDGNILQTLRPQSTKYQAEELCFAPWILLLYSFYLCYNSTEVPLC
uniref:Uncharacterized protein n=1 Tax=Gopherus evgoodei TaxID=1825980 RepID=A0A8C4WDB4_9SAUR